MNNGVWRGSIGITLSNYDKVSSYIPMYLGKLFTLNARFQPLGCFKGHSHESYGWSIGI